MLQNKNVYSMMVQQALKHAVERGKKDILFQAGDANEIAQWGQHYFKTVTVTKRNFNKFYENYANKIKLFGPRGVKRGDVIEGEVGSNICSVILETGTNYYKAYTSYKGTFSLLSTLTEAEQGWQGGDFHIDLETVATAVRDRKRVFYEFYDNKDYEGMLKTINELVGIITGKVPKY